MTAMWLLSFCKLSPPLTKPHLMLEDVRVNYHRLKGYCDIARGETK
jgi:hypothetical protein